MRKKISQSHLKKEKNNIVLYIKHTEQNKIYTLTLVKYCMDKVLQTRHSHTEQPSIHK